MDSLPFLHPDVLWLIAFGFAMAGIMGLLGLLLALPVLIASHVKKLFAPAPNFRIRQP